MENKKYKSNNTHIPSSLYCPGVHSSELGDFISPLLLKAFEFIVVNICFDWSLERRSQLRNKCVGTKILSLQQILRRSNGHKVGFTKLGQLVIFSKFGWKGGCNPWIKTCTQFKIENHTCGNLNFQNWSSHASSTCGLSSLSGWWVPLILNLNVIFGACLLSGVLPKLLEIAYSYDGQHPWARKLAPLLKS